MTRKQGKMAWGDVELNSLINICSARVSMGYLYKNGIASNYGAQS